MRSTSDTIRTCSFLMSSSPPAAIAADESLARAGARASIRVTARAEARHRPAVVERQVISIFRGLLRSIQRPGDTDESPCAAQPRPLSLFVPLFLGALVLSALVLSALVLSALGGRRRW